jgi:hypothetical protein
VLLREQVVHLDVYFVPIKSGPNKGWPRLEFFESRAIWRIDRFDRVGVFYYDALQGWHYPLIKAKGWRYPLLSYIPRRLVEVIPQEPRKSTDFHFSWEALYRTLDLQGPRRLWRGKPGKAIVPDGPRIVGSGTPLLLAKVFDQPVEKDVAPDAHVRTDKWKVVSGRHYWRELGAGCGASRRVSLCIEDRKRRRGSRPRHIVSRLERYSPHYVKLPHHANARDRVVKTPAQLLADFEFVGLALASTRRKRKRHV